MKRIIAALLLLAVTGISKAQLPAGFQADKKLHIGFHKNVELLGFAYFLAYEGLNSETKMVSIDGVTMPEKDWQMYGYAFYRKYQQFQTSKHLARALSITEHLWLSHILPLLMNVADFPNASIPAALDSSVYLAFSRNKNAAEAKANASLFLEACNAFYKEVNFDAYLVESAVYYKAALEQIKHYWRGKGVINYMEAFYRQSFYGYALVPSLTLPKGMGFGVQVSNGKERISCNVFGGTGRQEISDVHALNMGFGDTDKLRELSIHEFGHAFVNPYIERLPKQLLDSCSLLFDTVKVRMEEQGYNTWESCVIEHFVRAGEVVVAAQMGSPGVAEKLKQEYVNDRRFIYLPMLIDALREYGTDYRQHYSAVVLHMMRRFIKKATMLR